MSDVQFKYDKTALKNIEGFFAKQRTVKIGVLSSQWKENPDGEHERKIGPVELAMVHEFGSAKRHIPQRSFLRLTMFNRMADFLRELDANHEKIKQRMAAGNYAQILSNIGATWVRYVVETFERQGPDWQALADRTLAARRAVIDVEELKKNPKAPPRPSNKILWVTGAMMRSITFEVGKAR